MCQQQTLIEKILAALSVILIGLAVWEAVNVREDNRLSPTDLEKVTELLLAEVNKLLATAEPSGALREGSRYQIG